MSFRSTLENCPVPLSESERRIGSILLAASYNVGPRLVAGWLDGIHHENDALLFMESIPYPQTRTFVQHILTNYWTYRARFGESSPSLDTIASGEWPLYDGGTSPKRWSRHAEN